MNKSFPKSVIQYKCYHGTDVKEIKTLDKSRIQKDYRTGADSGYLGWGFYLTNDKNYAAEYGDNILEFDVDIQHPFKLGETKINFYSMVSFLFKDSKDELQENIQNSLEVIKRVSRSNYGEFKTIKTNTTTLLCRKTYFKYKDKVLTDENIEDIKNIFVLLSEDPKNWLNGLYFYFSKQLFHYFILNKFDGVIAENGKEVVIYESNQIKQLNTIEEELDLEPIKTFASAKVGDKFKLKATGDICTITGIREYNDDTLIIDYDYDKHTEDAPSKGAFKYHLNGGSQYSNARFELLN